MNSYTFTFTCLPFSRLGRGTPLLHALPLQRLVSAPMAPRFLSPLQTKFLATPMCTIHSQIQPTSTYKVALHRARLLLGWVTVCRQLNHLAMYQPLRSTQPSIPPGFVVEVGWAVFTCVGWPVILCDPIYSK